MRNMFKTLIVMASFFAATASFAAGELGSQCRLTDDNANHTWEEIPNDTFDSDLSHATRRQIEKLPTLVKQQLIIAVRIQAEEVVKSAYAAVQLLREASSDGDLYVYHLKINGRKYTVVKHYPGDNPYGVIFAYGTTRAVAVMSDSDVICL